MRLSHSHPVDLVHHQNNSLGFQGTRYPDETFSIHILSPNIVRVCHYPDGEPRLNRTWMIVEDDNDVPYEGRLRNTIAPQTKVPHLVETDAQQVKIQTDTLQIEVALGDFSLTWRNKQNEVIAQDIQHRAYPFDRAGESIFHYQTSPHNARYYGFGERSGELNKHGRRLRMVNFDSLGYNAQTTDPLYKHVPFYITFLPEQGITYGLLYDNLATTTFDLGCEIDAYAGSYYRYYHAEAGDLDYYFIYGPTIPDVLEQYSSLVGRMHLPPKWSLGYLGSTMLYTEQPDAQDQLKQFVELCEEHQIPCDMFHLSSGYATGKNGNRYVFHWNRDRIPEPKAMIDHFHEAGIHLSANCKPYFLTTHPDYQYLKSEGYFIQNAEGDEPELTRLWSGGAFTSGQGAYFDFTNLEAYRWWQAQLKAALIDLGIDSVWNDNNEYQLWDDEAQCHGMRDTILIGIARPLQTLLMNRASFEVQSNTKPNERPFVLTRSGCPGIQRYAQTWSGDNMSDWDTLRYNIPMGLGMGLSGIPNIGHDVGGFFGPKPDAELFLRWIQNGIFHPRFTIHSYNTDGTVNEPWMYPELLPFVRNAIRFRYRLLPYLYNLFLQANLTGQPIIRPLVYHFPDDPKCWDESFDFMLGADLLVPSVLNDGDRERDVYLPQGTNWFDFFAGTRYEGGQTITLPAPLESFPLLAREGAMIPMGKVMQYIGEQADDEREVLLFPPLYSAHIEWSYREDDGISLDYKNGVVTDIRVTLGCELDHVSVNVQTEGRYQLPYDRIRFVLPIGDPRTLSAENIIEQGVDAHGRRWVMLHIMQGDHDA